MEHLHYTSSPDGTERLEESEVWKTRVKLCLLEIDYTMNEITAAVTVYTRTEQNQTSQHSNMEWGRGHESPHLNKKLLTADHFWVKEELIFFKCTAFGRLTLLQ